MKNHWNYSCFKAKTTIMAENTMPSAIGKLFILSLYVKQPKGTVLRLGDGTEITIV
jgi:hypothetical protein